MAVSEARKTRPYEDGYVAEELPAGPECATPG